MEGYQVLFREYYLFGINNEKIGIKKKVIVNVLD